MAKIDLSATDILRDLLQTDIITAQKYAARILREKPDDPVIGIIADMLDGYFVG